MGELMNLQCHVGSYCIKKAPGMLHFHEPEPSICQCKSGCGTPTLVRDDVWVFTDIFKVMDLISVSAEPSPNLWDDLLHNKYEIAQVWSIKRGLHISSVVDAGR